MDSSTEKLISDFPERLRKLRRRCDLSQIELATELGIDKQRISKYERGMTHPPLETLAQLSRRLGVSVDYLLMGEELIKAELQTPNEELERCFSQVRHLPEDQQRTIVELLNSFIQRQKLLKHVDLETLDKG